MNAHPDVVAHALDAAEDPAARWPSVAGALCRYLDAKTIRIMAFSPETKERYIDLVTVDWPEKIKQEYDDHYLDSDPRIAAGMNYIGRSVACIDTMDYPVFEKSALVCDFLDRAEVDARWGLLHVARSSAGHTLLLGACRARKAGPFLQEDKDRFNAVLTPVKRALDFDARLASVERGNDVLEATLDVLSNPIIVLSDTLRVLHMNARAEELLRGNNGLRVIRGRLHAVRPADQAGLERIVYGSSADNGARIPHAAVISSDQGPFLLVRAHRLPRSNSVATADPSRQCALVFTSVGRVDQGIDAVLKAFGLTAAELNLVRQLLLGARLPEVAAEAGVSIETVRSQLKRAREKVGVRRQSDLIRFLAQYG